MPKTPKQLEMERVRDFILGKVRSVVVGPVGADDERLGCSPHDLYLSGILYPRNDAMGLAEDDDSAAAEDSAEADNVVPPRSSFKPSSLGVTFTIRNGVTFRVSMGASSRYLKSFTEQGSSVWSRRRVSIARELVSGRNAESLDFPEEKLRIHVLARVGSEHTTYTLSLVNEAQPAESDDYAAAMLYQSQLVIECDQPAFVSRQTTASGSADEAGINNMLYRKSMEFAVGHGIAAMWDGPGEGQVARIWTDWMPVQRVESTSAEGHQSLAEFLRKHPAGLSAQWLGSADKKQVVDSLADFLTCYSNWIDGIEAACAVDAAGHEHAALAQVGECRRALTRMRQGLMCLESDSAWAAFQVANQAMDRQSRFAGKGPSARPLVWRPFQLGFLLLSVESIANPSSAARDEMDLLWFPTGGGKTEAYLFLAAFTIFHKRLASPARRESGGIDVLMRYTLRLLTVQQYQRAVAVMLACDQIRAENATKWGRAAITAGLFVGSDTTPNNLQAAIAALADPSAKSTPRILQSCPCCGMNLEMKQGDVNLEHKTLFTRCVNSNCEISRGRGIPSITVDEVIYAHPPSLLLATVDKFAQLPRNSNAGVVLRNDNIPPDLIIQDELHLISGPLGSIAGLYEVLIDELCTSDRIRPKIVGSSATVGGALRQVRALFDRQLMQFPPAGIDSHDSFYAVREAEAPDRLYVGLSNSGRSPKFALQFAQAAIMQAAHLANVLKIADTSAVDPYWTALVYYNTIRELGAGLTMSSDDVPMTMQTFARQMDAKVSPRTNKTMPLELSSNVKSADIPLRLKQLSKSLGGPPFEPPVDVVLASNIISVGLDIPRLGVMVMNQQPKTVSEYIQATSRVGRGIPGLVFTLHNVLRPRDASHFEHFKHLHSTLYKGVEANSVTPWASRARDKCMAPVFTAMVRYLMQGMLNDEQAIAFAQISDDEIERLIERVAGRAQSSGRHNYGNEDCVRDLKTELRNFCVKWKRLALAATDGGYRFVYWRNSPSTKSALIRSAEEPVVKPDETPAPNSMRDVEPSTAYILNR